MPKDEQNTTNAPKAKQKRISQGDIPAVPLEQAEKVAFAIAEQYAGDPTPPHDVAIALDISPTSSTWRILAGAAAGYGLTSGGPNAQNIELTEIGRKLALPLDETSENEARRAAALTPTIASKFYEKYNRSKWPKPEVAVNVLHSLGVPRDRAKEINDLLFANAEAANFIRAMATGSFLALDAVAEKAETPRLENQQIFDQVDDASHIAEKLQLPSSNPEDTLDQEVPRNNFRTNNRVFITHGKNTSVVEQIKEVVSMGGFEPVVSIQEETTAKPIPSKVMDDMRSCGAAIIHVSAESRYEDSEGQIQNHINSNVLIEIGAAMALYEQRFILLVEDGAKLPSNLQGLYETRYQGAQLTFEAAMKVLKALRGMKDKT